MAEEEEEGLRVDSKHRNNNNWVIGSGRSGVQTVYTDSKYLHYFLLTSCTQLFFNIEIILYYAEVRPFCVEGKNSEIGMKLVIKFFQVKNSDAPYFVQFCDDELIN